MDVAVQQAFQAMQNAERQKDVDPRAYREAKVKYYRMAQGEEWVQQERQRLLEEANGITAEWLTQQDSLKSQREAQQTTLEMVRSAEGGTLGLQEDVQQAVDLLKKLIRKEKDRKQLDSRLAQQTTSPGGGWLPPSWLYTFLDILIVGLLVQVCQVVYSKYYRNNPYPSSPFLSGT